MRIVAISLEPVEVGALQFVTLRYFLEGSVFSFSRSSIRESVNIIEITISNGLISD